MESPSFLVSPLDRVRIASRLREIIDSGEGVDLHSHSNHSDGEWTPPELIAEATRIGLKLVSLTDHDTVSGQHAAEQAATESDILLLNGIEVSLTVEGRLYHVLGFDFDPAAPSWIRFAEARMRRFDEYLLGAFDVARVRGYAVDPDAARGLDGHFGNHALAIALERVGAAPSPEAAQQLARSILPPRPVELTYQDVFEFAELLRPGDAVFSVAHPARDQAGVSVRLSEADLLTLRRALPLVALEASHPYHSSADAAYFADLASKHGLAVTCGSDAHGHRHRRPLQRYPATLSREFLEIIHGRWVARARTELATV